MVFTPERSDAIRTGRPAVRSWVTRGLRHARSSASIPPRPRPPVQPRASRPLEGTGREVPGRAGHPGLRVRPRADRHPARRVKHPTAAVPGPGSASCGRYRSRTSIVDAVAVDSSGGSHRASTDPDHRRRAHRDRCRRVCDDAGRELDGAHPGVCGGAAARARVRRRQAVRPDARPARRPRRRPAGHLRLGHEHVQARRGVRRYGRASRRPS